MCCSSQVTTLIPMESEPFWRGQIFARMILANKRGENIYSRPIGINPYPMFSDEYYSWDEGYEFETERIIYETMENQNV